MREIKFRVWDNYYKYMNYKVLVGVYGEWEKVKDDKNYSACSMWIEPKNVDYKCEPHWAHFEPYHEDIKLMEFTGLKDKHGKEIYEGDILNIDKEDYKYVVKCYDGCFVGVNKFDEHYEQAKIIGNLFTLEIEVIGNIYENPELIN